MQKTTFNQGMLRQWLPTKLLLIMKMIVIILTACFMQVSAASVAQKLNYSKKGATLKQIFSEIRKQTGYFVVYSDANVNAAQKIDVHFVHTELKQVLETLGDAHQLSYEIDEKNITIMPKENSIMKKLSNFFTDITVRGKVVDAEGNPLPGASVKAGGKVVITDGKGEFQIDGVDENTMLEVSYIGFTTKTIKPSSERMFITLQSSASELQEVTINKGYYEVKKELNTGSVGTLKAEDISKQPVGDPLMALEGRIPGLFVSQNSGVPGANVNVVLRGTNSIANGNSPLYIVDGIPFNSKTFSQLTNAAGYQSVSPFASIRPNDIESVEILKDAEATAIYGSRGANGVILITTKKGKLGQPKVDANIYHGLNYVARKLDLLKTPEYLEMRNEALANDNATPRANEYDVNGTWSKTKYTDWQEMLVGETARTTDANASISGGNQQSRYLLGFGYRKDGFVFPGDFSNTIGSGNMNINHKSNSERFQANFSTNYSINKNKLPTTDFTQYIFMAPNAPDIYDAKGQLNWENNTFDNPFAYLRKTARVETENLISNLTLQYDIWKGIQIKVNGGYTSTRYFEQNISPYSSVMPTAPDPSVRRTRATANNGIKAYIIEPQLNYNLTLKDHHFDALIGTTFNESSQESSVENASGFASDLQIPNSGAATNLRSTNAYSQYRYNAVYLRLGYNFHEKYILSLTGRRDGSSRFGPGMQFGNFGAIGAAWIFSKEKIVSGALPFLSLGKIRASIGKTGNDQLINYEYLSTYSPSVAYFGLSTLNPDKLTNSKYQWETINKIEAALELGFVNNRINLTVGIYRNRTGNQLVGYSLPATTGFTRITANLPAVIENKGIEIEVTSTNVQSKHFNWTTSFNLTAPKNKLVSYPNIESSAYNQIYFVGKPLSTVQFYHYTGIDPQTGLYTFEDFDKNGSVDYIEDRRPNFIGQKFYGGFNNSFKYKGIGIDVFFQFVKQTAYKYLSNGTPGFYRTGGRANQPAFVLDRWISSTSDVTYQKFTARSDEALMASEMFLESDGMITDASYIRLKNVALSYELPRNICSKLKVQSVRIYLQAQNLLTITNYHGMDPENALGVGYGMPPSLPPLRTIAGGLQMSL